MIHRWMSMALAVCLVACGRTEAPETLAVPDGAFAFAAFGDMPYSGDDLFRVERLIRELRAQELEWVINVGDILWYPCSDSAFEHRLGLLRSIGHPVVYTPGDNEWADCHGGITGRYEPLERLQRLREMFFAEPMSPIGGGAMELEFQSEQFPENVVWTFRGITLATLHVVGSHNARNPFHGRGPEHDREVELREQATLRWLDRTFDRAGTRGSQGIVLVWHAAPGFRRPVGHEWRRGYENILERLEQRVADWERPVLLIHGDDHEYVVDRPLRDRRTGKSLVNFTRVEVMGSPEVGWVRILVHPGAQPLFAVEPYYIRRGWWYLKRVLGG